MPVGEVWTNWSGSLRFTPAGYAEPDSEGAVVELVRRAQQSGTTLRPVGSGHSSSPLVRTDGILVSLDRFSGLIEKDVAARRATVGAGTQLRQLGEGLHAAGMAMDNLGDVDYQTLAGATATGTHGTGPRFGNLCTQIVGARLIAGTGEVLDVSTDRNAELLPAVRLSLGAFGIITRITLALQQHYELHRRTWCGHIAWTLDNLHELQHTNRNMDFYWYPRSDQVQIRTMNPPHEPPSGFQPMDAPREITTGPSHRTFPQERVLRFEEVEYMLPAEAFVPCFTEIRQRIKERHRRTVGWRVLVRTVAADDIYLSPAYGQDTVTIACLQNNLLPHEEYFRDMEAVFRHYGGRPHWGKRHGLAAPELRPLYPRWDEFQAIRRRLDPDGVFLSPDLARLLEEP